MADKPIPDFLMPTPVAAKPIGHDSGLLRRMAEVLQVEPQEDIHDMSNTDTAPAPRAPLPPAAAPYAPRPMAPAPAAPSSFQSPGDYKAPKHVDAIKERLKALTHREMRDLVVEIFAAAKGKGDNPDVISRADMPDVLDRLAYGD